MGKGGGKGNCQKKKKQQKKAACIAIAVILVIVLVVLVVLYLAVYRPRDPRVQVPTMQLLSLYPASPAASTANLTLNLLVSIYNPNRATFLVQSGGVACLYYRGAQVGFTPILPGSVPAESSSTIAVSLTVQGSAPLQGPYLQIDIGDGVLPVSTSVTIVGRVKTLNLFTHHADVVSKCAISVSLSSRGIQSYTCQRSFSMDS